MQLIIEWTTDQSYPGRIWQSGGEFIFFSGMLLGIMGTDCDDTEDSMKVCV